MSNKVISKTLRLWNFRLLDSHIWIKPNPDMQTHQFSCQRSKLGLNVALVVCIT